MYPDSEDRLFSQPCDHPLDANVYTGQRAKGRSCEQPHHTAQRVRQQPLGDATAVAIPSTVHALMMPVPVSIPSTLHSLVMPVPVSIPSTLHALVMPMPVSIPSTLHALVMPMPVSIPSTLHDPMTPVLALSKPIRWSVDTGSSWSARCGRRRLPWRTAGTTTGPDGCPTAIAGDSRSESWKHSRHRQMRPEMIKTSRFVSLSVEGTLLRQVNPQIVRNSWSFYP